MARERIPAEFVDPRKKADTPRVRYFVQFPMTSNWDHAGGK